MTPEPIDLWARERQEVLFTPNYVVTVSGRYAYHCDTPEQVNKVRESAGFVEIEIVSPKGLNVSQFKSRRTKRK